MEKSLVTGKPKSFGANLKRFARDRNCVKYGFQTKVKKNKARTLFGKNHTLLFRN
jgi:hypothetical protein